jgi:G3E family GTPase
MERTPIHVIGGFLGAGKTTALRHLLQTRGERIAVVVNDFGDARIDAGIIEGLGGRADGPAIQEIAGGCICCTAPAGFAAAIETLLTEVRPDRILVEPTGLARPQDLVDTLRRGPLAARLQVGPSVVLVDPRRLVGPAGPDAVLLRQQAEGADILVASFDDRCGDAERAAFRAYAAALWPGPLAMHFVSQGALPASVLVWPEDEGAAAPRFRLARLPASPSTQGYAGRSMVWDAATRFHGDRLRAAMADLAEEAALVRLKGVFSTVEGVLRVDIANAEVHLATSPWRRDSRVDVILRAQGDVAEDLFDVAMDLLAGAVLRDHERVVDDERLEIVGPDGLRHSFDRAALGALPGGVPDVSVLIPKRRGSAARLRAVFDAAGIAGDGMAVAIAADGMSSDPVAVGDLDAALVVYALGDGALPAGDGGPLRLLIPGDAGPAGPCSNVKGLVRVVVR